jgi:hypothetical protein
VFLQQAQPDVLIAEAGTMELQPVLSKCQNLSKIMWVTKAGSVHMDFAESPEKVGGKVTVSTWHELVEEHKSPEMSGVPPVEKDSLSPSLSIAESTNTGVELTEYTSGVCGY